MAARSGCISRYLLIRPNRQVRASIRSTIARDPDAAQAVQKQESEEPKKDESWRTHFYDLTQDSGGTFPNAVPRAKFRSSESGAGNDGLASANVPDAAPCSSEVPSREEYGSDGVTLLRRTELSRGQKVYVEEDADGDGRLDHRVWFVNGRPVRGERSLSGDGVFPIKETWSGGKLVKETFISGFPETDSAPGQRG